MRVKVIPAAQAVQWVAAKPDKTVGASFGAVSINAAACGLCSGRPPVEVSAGVAGEADTLGGKSSGAVFAAPGCSPGIGPAGAAGAPGFDPFGKVPDGVTADREVMPDIWDKSCLSLFIFPPILP